MNGFRQMLLGFGAALLSLAIVLGGFSMALTESGQLQAMLPTFSSPVEISITPPLFLTSLPPSLETTTPMLDATQTPAESLLPTFTETQVLVATLPPGVAVCANAPADWSRIVVQAGDTLDSLAQAYGTSVDALRQSNCLVSNQLIPGSTLLVPGLPLPTAVSCGPPRGWVYYVVQPGDTLSRLSQLFGVTVQQLQEANCMGNETLIRWGTRLLVPNVPVLTLTPSRTATLTPTPTAEPSLTNTLPPTITPFPTSTRTLPYTPSATVTSPPEPTDTQTPLPSETATPTLTPLPTLTPTWTLTATGIITGSLP